MSGIDRTAPIEVALVIHPVRTGQAVLRSPEAKLDEAIGLSQALDLDVRAAEIAPLRRVTPATLFGSGKVQEFKAKVEEIEATIVVVDDALTPVQQRNLEKAWNAKVIDRTGLILEIFARRARTAEGKLQVELARLAYERSRLVRTWTHLERQRGGFGFLGGPGETQIEADRRLLADRIAKLKKDLEEVRRTRGLHRSARRRVPYPSIALVGYTNAGKSTLFNQLTGAHAVAKDMLFATLDPTLRTVRLPNGRSAILSDTVGFISDLPHELVEAFRATLEEVQEADVILHVRDIADADSDAQSADVSKVLETLDISDSSLQPLIEIWNKIDLVEPDDRTALEGRARRLDPAPALVSAVSGEGCEALLRRLGDLVDRSPPVEVRLPAGDGNVVAWLYRNGRVVSREDADDGSARIWVRLDEQAMGRFERMFPEAQLLPNAAQ